MRFLLSLMQLTFRLNEIPGQPLLQRVAQESNVPVITTKRSIAQMHFNTLEPFRQQMYGCFERSRDALFNLCDALASEPQAHSLPELSLSVFFERRWPSIYEALQDGRINVERLRTTF